MKNKMCSALFAMLMLLILCAAALAQGPKTIDVTGHADSSAKPDLMTLSFTVLSHAESADECTRNESETTRRVTDALKAKLGDSAKITTSDFSFNPSIEYGNPLATATPTVSEPPATWQFKSDVNVYTDSMDPIGDLIQTGLAAGATSVSQSGITERPADQDATPKAGVVTSFSNTDVNSGVPLNRRFKRMFSVTLMVLAQGTSPPDAVRKGAALTEKVEAALNKQVGAPGRVEVEDYNVMELNEQNQQGIPRYQPLPPQQPQRKIYEAQVTVSAETTKLDLLGPSVEGAINAGATRLNQVSFTLKDDSAARKEAIEKASADAKSKAETLANSMGVKLKGVLRISTNAQARPYIVNGNQYAAAQALHRSESFSGAVAAPQMTVTPRDVGFGADVNVTYQIE